MALCKENGILVTAYSPLGSTGGPLLKEEKVLKVAEKHGVDVGAVLLNYHGKWLFLCLMINAVLTQGTVNRGIVVLAKSVTPSRIEANNKLLKLDEEDLEVLGSIYKEKGPQRYVIYHICIWFRNLADDETTDLLLRHGPSTLDSLTGNRVVPTFLNPLKLHVAFMN